MRRRPKSIVIAGRALAGSLFALALLAGAAPAKTWQEWAPAPLAADSSYAELSSRPDGLLAPRERQWVAVQRNWREWRRREAHPWGTGITELSRHVERPGDARFAALASRPFAAVGDADLAWLVSENAAQRKANGEVAPSEASKWVGVTVLSAIVGATVAYLYLHQPSRGYTVF